MEKQLKIATGSCKRLAKEVALYSKEAEEQAAKVEAMREGDEYERRQQEAVLDETRRMLPDCRKRLQMARDKLQGLVREASEAEDDSVTLTTAFSEAEEVLRSEAI